MPDRKHFLGDLKASPELIQLLQRAARKQVTDEELREQRISFAYGNAPASSNITKESVRLTSLRMRPRPLSE